MTAQSTQMGEPPPGFLSAHAKTNGTRLHYVRGGAGPAIVLLHGFPEDWVAYKALMPRLAERFTVVAIDLPGIGRSAPARGGYETANLAAHIHALANALTLERPYVVGHDLGGLTTYAYVRRYPDSLRGAMIVDVPVPGVAGWDEAVAGNWLIPFIQQPGLAEQMVPGRQAAFLGWCYNIGRGFTPEQRAYYIEGYNEPQLHAAFEIYRGFPKDGEWNAAQTAPNAVPVVIAIGANSFFAPFVTTFVEGYRAKGLTHVESALIPDATHYLLADNPSAVAELIERYAGHRPRGASGAS